MTRQQITYITWGILLSLFLASMEGTVVATAMPTIVAQLGGLSIYSWVFSIYMLTSTTTGPVYGKLSDIFGRRRLYVFSMLLFLAGSVLCALSRTMEQLIVFRAIQGLGAGGVLPLAFTIIGEIFTLEERARMQGLFSGVWGVSSVIGPFIGGFLVDRVAWQWVFLINLLPGALAVGLVWLAWRDGERTAGRRRVDYGGAALLMLGGVCLLLGLNQIGTPAGWWALGASGLLFALLAWVEGRAADPILPLYLFRRRLFNVSIVHGFLSGWAMFGSLSYVPLFVQAVLGTSATRAGIALTPMSLSWTLASIFGGRLLLKMGYRTLALIGMLVMTAGNLLLAGVGVHSSEIGVMVYTGMMGVGMGLSVPAFLIAVQSSVCKADLGAATSTIQFSRNIGGTLGVSVLGALLSAGLAQHLLASGLDAGSVNLNSLIDPLAGGGAAFTIPLRIALGAAMGRMFFAAFVASLGGLLAVFFAPGGKIAQMERIERPAEV
ncbi:MAG: MFS transporter [Anaerolineae bacterium]|nr:MFS transporter [Anaerolineae bacterium]